MFSPQKKKEEEEKEKKKKEKKIIQGCDFQRVGFFFFSLMANYCL